MTLKSGEVREAFIGSCRGGLESPLTDDELGLKFEGRPHSGADDSHNTARLVAEVRRLAKLAAAPPPARARALP